MKDWEEMGRFPEVNKLPVNVRVEPFLTFLFGKFKLNIVSDIICVNEVHWMSHCLYLTTIHCMLPIESDSIMNPATLMTLQVLYLWQRYRRVRKVRFISCM